jgi:hypothetical protein
MLFSAEGGSLSFFPASSLFYVVKQGNNIGFKSYRYDPCTGITDMQKCRKMGFVRRLYGRLHYLSQQKNTRHQSFTDLHCAELVSLSRLGVEASSPQRR